MADSVAMGECDYNPDPDPDPDVTPAACTYTGLAGDSCPVHEKYHHPEPDPWPGKMVSVPDLRDKTSAERKAEPIHSGVLLYFPDALAAVARVSKAGNDKHNPGEPLHWARNKSTDQMDCATRHTLTPELIDPETGEPELAAAVWRLLAQLQLLEEKRNAARGVRSYSGIAP